MDDIIQQRDTIQSQFTSLQTQYEQLQQVLDLVLDHTKIDSIVHYREWIQRIEEYKMENCL